MDGSHHRWLGDTVPPFALLLAVDDATGGVVSALFCEKEDSRGYFLLMHGLVQHLGLPLALYTDRREVFKHTPAPGKDGKSTQFSRAMEELGIQTIFALSPQAKGRVERAARTFQDRLITEFRLAGATSIEEANTVLAQFLPRFNQRFRVPASCSHAAFRHLNPELCLEQVLCFKHRRKVGKDNTVKFQLHTLQLLPDPNDPATLGQLWRSWKGWMVGCPFAMRGAPFPLRRRRPLRYSSETGPRTPQACRRGSPSPMAGQKPGQRIWCH